MTVSDADRERVIALLREQAGEGRLDMDEFGQRLDEAYQATTLDQLQYALRELPVPAVTQPPTPPKPPPSSIRREAPRPRGPRGPMPPNLTPEAKAKISNAAWRAHLTTYLWVNLLLVAIWAMAGMGYFWPMWSIVPWGFGLAMHGSGHRAAVRAREAKRQRELGQG